MRRLAIASLSLAAAVALAACGGSATTTPASSSAPAASTTAAGTPAPVAGTPVASAPATGDAVTIANFAFAPASITVRVGQGVAWTNQDSATHTVTWDDGTAGSSNLAPGGATYSRTFDTPGTFTYHCAIHPSMKGTVVVQP